MNAAAPILLDGGLATQLEAAGHDLSGSLWSARLLRDDPEAIVDAHLAYFRAGAQVAVTASYQASFEGFAAAGIGREETALLIRRSVELAARARERYEREAAVSGLRVAGSVGPYGAMLAGGQEYTGEYGGAGRDELRAFHRPRIAELVAARADLLAVETIPKAVEAEVLVELLEEAPIPAWISFCCRDGGHLADGTRIEEAVAIAARASRLLAVGVNCTSPEHVEPLLAAARSATDLPFVVYPNDGRAWDAASRRWIGRPSGGITADRVRRWRELGAGLIGGCCGVDAHGLGAIAAAVAA
jgi:homocysteine S-methyltransferase